MNLNSTRTATKYFAALVAAMASMRAIAAIEVSNLGETPDAGTTINDTVLAASPFTTDGGFYTLNAVTLAFYNSGGLSGGPVSFSASVMADNAGQPGTLLTNLSAGGPLAVDSFGNFTFTGACGLNPNTTYWVVVRTNGPFAYALGTTSNGQSAPGGWTVGDGAARRSYDNGASWTGPTGWVQRLEIDASPTVVLATVTNIGEMPNGGTTINNTVWAATPFTTGAAASTLTAAFLAVYNDAGLGGGNAVTFNALLMSDSSGHPGAVIEDLGNSAPVSSGSFTDVTFSSIGSALAANTTYWIALRTTGPLAYALGTTSTSELSSQGWTIGDNEMRRTYDNAASWTGPMDISQRFSIYATTNTGCGFDPCDTNCNGTVNPFDIQPFIELLGPTPPTQCSPCAGDANENGTVNPFDINAFLNCLS